MNLQEDKIKKCSLCGNLPKLVENSVQIGKTNFIIIGESPAKDGWITSKKAFYNTAGKLQGTGRVLEKLLNNIGLSINDIYFTEFCKCIIENRKDLDKCSHNCKPILMEQLKDIPCKIIVPMGVSTTAALLGIKIKKFSEVVGRTYNIKIGDKECIVLPIYHPSPLNPKGYKENLPIFENLKELSE